MKTNLFDLIFKSLLQVSVSCNNLVDDLCDKKTPMNKGKHTKRDALHSAYELVCVAQNQLQYLLKVRQATCGCKLKQQEEKGGTNQSQGPDQNGAL